MLLEVRMLGEVMVFAMLQHEETLGLQQLSLKDDVGQRWQLLQGVGWVGKDKVELLLTAFQKTKSLSTQRHYGDCFRQFMDTVTDETVVVSVQLYAHHLTTPS